MVRALMATLGIAAAGCLSTPGRPDDSSCTTVRQLTELHSTRDSGPWLSADHLEIVFSRADGNGVLMSARRATVDMPFDPPQPLVGIQPCGDAAYPFLSADSLRIWFTCTGSELWSANRPTRDVPFQDAKAEPGFVNAPNAYYAGSLDQAELTLVFTGDNGHMYKVTRASTSDPLDVTTATELAVSAGSAFQPSLSADGNTLMFTGRVTGTDPNLRIFRSTRASNFTLAEQVTGLGDVDGTSDTSVQQNVDGTTITLSSDRVGGGKSAIYTTCN